MPARCCPMLWMASGTLALAAWADDTAEGRAIFDGKGQCRRCHSIQGRGGSVGPDLSTVGLMRTPESLRLALTDPDAEIYREFLTTVVETGRGRRVEGITLNEDDLSIQIRDIRGDIHSFLKSDLKIVRREQRSLMPSFAGKLSAAEVSQLAGFLWELRGAPPAVLERRREPAPLSENLAWLGRPERDSDERPETLLDALSIQPGMTVADVGAGFGYFTWRLARRVGARGRVLAIDIQPEMVQRLRQEAQERELAQVEAKLGTARNPGIEEKSLDLALLANSYHEFSEPEAVLAALRKSLKPGGSLVVIEYRKEEPSPMSPLHRMSLVELRAEIEPAGFDLVRILDFLPLQHGLIFRPRP